MNEHTTAFKNWQDMYARAFKEARTASRAIHRDYGHYKDAERHVSIIVLDPSDNPPCPYSLFGVGALRESWKEAVNWLGDGGGFTEADTLCFGHNGIVMLDRIPVAEFCEAMRADLAQREASTVAGRGGRDATRTQRTGGGE